MKMFNQISARLLPRILQCVRMCAYNVGGICFIDIYNKIDSTNTIF